MENQVKVRRERRILLPVRRRGSEETGPGEATETGRNRRGRLERRAVVEKEETAETGVTRGATVHEVTWQTHFNGFKERKAGKE